MARIRTVKPEFWTNSTTGKLSGPAAKLYLGLHNHSDDYGVVRDDADELRARILPYERGGDVVERALGELEAAGANENPHGLIVRFRIAQKRYIWLAYFSKHQKVDRPGPPLIEGWNALSTPHGYAISTNDREDSTNARDHSRALAIVPRGIGEDRSGEEITVVDQARPATETDQVWADYQHRHPRARATPGRRRLIQRRLQDFSLDVLLAAIDGNHRDPHCNGQNRSGTEYHSLELILRDVEHIERYADLAEKNGRRKAVEVWVDDRPARDPAAHERLRTMTTAMLRAKEMPA